MSIEAMKQTLEALEDLNIALREAILAAVIEQAEKQEPRQEAQIVNWNCPCGKTVTFRGFTQAPPPRQPLTSDEIDDIANDYSDEFGMIAPDSWEDFAQAILKAAHGIKDNT